MSQKTLEKKRDLERDLAKTEKAIARKSDSTRSLEERWRVSYDELAEDIRAANAKGLSYERLGLAAKLSKTQVQRICNA